MPNPQCVHQLEDGRQCGCIAVDGSELCINHDPARREQKLEACRKGGEARRTPPKPPLPVITIKDIPDLEIGLQKVMELFADRQINPNEARLMMENIKLQASVKWNTGGYITGR